MDEGWASFLPTELEDRIDPDYNSFTRRTWSYENAAGEEAEFPPMLLSYSNTGKHKRTAHYNRPQLAIMPCSGCSGGYLSKSNTGIF